MANSFVLNNFWLKLMCLVFLCRHILNVFIDSAISSIRVCSDLSIPNMDSPSSRK